MSAHRSHRTLEPRCSGIVVASIAVAPLSIGYIAFYFLLFLPRGPVG
jgi:hypothetical protein